MVIVIRERFRAITPLPIEAPVAEPPEITFRRPPLFTVALKSLPPMTISVGAARR